jgi:hypothetical protein
MSSQRMDADTAETPASGCCAGQPSSCGRLSTPRVLGLLDRCWGWASTWPRTKRATSCRPRFQSTRLRRSGNRPVSSAPPSSSCGAPRSWKPGLRLMLCGRGWPTWCGKRTQVSTADGRTVAELLAESDAVARETLLDATLEHAPAMVRSWNQLVGSAVKLWTVLPSEPNNTSRADPMEQLRAIGEAIGRSVTTGHWPGHGATDEHLTQIADNLSRARHLVDYHGRPSEPVTRTGMPTPHILTAR